MLAPAAFIATIYNFNSPDADDPATNSRSGPLQKESPERFMPENLVV